MAKKFAICNLNKIICCLLSVLLVTSLFLPITVHGAETRPETIKVGFFAFDGYHEIDENGQKSGYGYDFLTLMRRYSNLNYEYVGYDKSWSDMQQMLLDGEIDVVTSARKTAEREELYDYSLPIGTNTISLNARADDNRYDSGDYKSYNGMTIGLIEGSSSNEKVEDFADANGFSFVPKYYADVDGLENALKRGDVDAVATSSLRKMENEIVLCEFNTEYFYAIVRKGDTELLNKINLAIAQMNINEGDWQNALYYANYRSGNSSDLFFTDEEMEYIKQYSSGDKRLVFAVDTNWIPFSWKEDGKYVGIIPEIIDYCMNKCGMDYVIYDSIEEVNDATVLDNKGVDFYVGYSMSEETAEEDGLVASEAVLNCGSAYLVNRDTSVIKTVAVCDTTPYLNARLMAEDDIILKSYKDTESARKAVLKGKVDAAFLYDYDAEYSANHDLSGRLAYELISGGDIQIRAVMRNTDDRTPMSIWMKCLNSMTEAERTSIVSKYISHTATSISVSDYAILHPLSFFGSVCFLMVILGVAIIILIKNAEEKKHRMVLEDKVEEISALNSQLQDNQARLEESASEQEAQLEEITALNNQLAEDGDKMQELNLALKEALSQANIASKAKSDFLFSMSHDIRTPMNAIIGYANLMKKHQDDRELCADYLKKINTSSEFLLDLINNVLEMARIESGKIVLNETTWNVNSLNESLFTVFSEGMNQKKITYTRTIDVEHNYVYCDSVKVREIYLNILSNAMKYTPEGGSVLMALKELPSDREGYALMQTTVSDTGVGMSEEYLPHIFEEFSREQTVTENKIQGTGLGMPIVKKLVDMMDGTISVQSERGKGTTFVVQLYHKISSEDQMNQDDLFQKKAVDFSGMRILLAEDNEFNAEIAIEMLEEEGFFVEHAEDGEICCDMLEKADDNYYDFVLMDVQMPNMNGYEATKIIRKMDNKVKAKIPIIAMTANVFEEDKREAFRVGMNGHIAKPVKVTELRKTFAGIIA